MKKLFAIAILSAALLTTYSTAYAATSVSQTAVNNGGQSVAACAQMMNKGVSQCLNASGCNMY